VAELYPNLLLGAAGFSEGVMRALGIKGDLPRELYPLYGAHFQLDDFSRPEYQWTRRTSRWEAGVIVPPAVGFLGRAALLTRTTAANQRQVLAVCEWVEFTTPTAGGTGVQVGLSFGGTGVADPTLNASRRDDRILNKASNAFSIASGAPDAVNVLAGLNPRVYICAQNQTIRVDGPWILTNNDNGIFRSALIVTGTTGNVDLRVNYSWYERDLLPEEV
jgi:hypothetical protein